MEENIIIMPMFAALMITLIVVIASAFIKKGYGACKAGTY